MDGLDLIVFFLVTFGLAGIVIGWVAIEHLRRILDAQHTLIAQGSQRRQWVKQEHADE